MEVIYTDLDGTLLDTGTYSYAPAEPALALLRQKNAPLILCSSKTRAEMEMWRKKLNNTHPFIVENGAAIFVPRGYFGFPVPLAVSREGYEVIEFGDRYRDLVLALQTAARQSDCRVHGFHDWNAEQISLACGLPLEQAALAKQREYDEPFVVVENYKSRVMHLLAAIQAQGKRWTHGGHFFHIIGNNDKALAVRFLTPLFQKAFGQVRTFGLGDSVNDARFLRTVDVPVIVRSRSTEDLQKLIPHAWVTEAPGPTGWNEALLRYAG